ncbi:MAG TPA: hypothetical protein DCM87_17140 [Planctomycetes bacterium]|nr:hypothetical protein [Planctomycetota bacterium]
MTGALRAVAALGGLALAASFFVPWSDHRSPVRQFMAWTVESDFSADDRAALVFSIGVAVAIAYPYVWALVAAAGAWWSEHRRAGLWGQFACHIAGGGALAGLGVALRIWRDTWVPASAQQAAIAAPLILILLAGGTVLFVRPARRLAAVSIIGYIPHAMVGPVLAWAVYRDGGAPWGYLLGTLGALAGLAGNVCVFMVEGVRGRDVHRRSDVQ